MIALSYFGELSSQFWLTAAWIFTYSREVGQISDSRQAKWEKS